MRRVFFLFQPPIPECSASVFGNRIAPNSRCSLKLKDSGVHCLSSEGLYKTRVIITDSESGISGDALCQSFGVSYIDYHFCITLLQDGMLKSALALLPLDIDTILLHSPCSMNISDWCQLSL